MNPLCPVTHISSVKLYYGLGLSCCLNLRNPLGTLALVLFFGGKGKMISWFTFRTCKSTLRSQVDLVFGKRDFGGLRLTLSPQVTHCSHLQKQTWYPQLLFSWGWLNFIYLLSWVTAPEVLQKQNPKDPKQRKLTQIQGKNDLHSGFTFTKAKSHFEFHRMVLNRPRFIVSFAQSDLNRSETPSFLRVDIEWDLGWETVSKLNVMTQMNSSVIQLFEHINGTTHATISFRKLNLFVWWTHTGNAEEVKLLQLTYKYWHKSTLCYQISSEGYFWILGEKKVRILILGNLINHDEIELRHIILLFIFIWSILCLLPKRI